MGAIIGILALIGGPIGLATAGLQFGTEALKEAPVIARDVRRIEAEKRQRVAYLHVDRRTAAQRREYGPMRWMQ